MPERWKLKPIKLTFEPVKVKTAASSDSMNVRSIASDDSQ